MRRNKSLIAAQMPGLKQLFSTFTTTNFLVNAYIYFMPAAIEYFLFFSCTDDKSHLFTEMDKSTTGVNFQNTFLKMGH